MNNDLISRKWLTDAIRNRRTYLSYEDAKDVIDLINNAPTIDIKDEIAGAYNEGYMCGSREAEKARPQGEWEYVQYDANPNIGNWHCSECRHIVSGKYDQKPDYNFCPRCGARMNYQS